MVEFIWNVGVIDVCWILMDADGRERDWDFGAELSESHQKARPARGYSSTYIHYSPWKIFRMMSRRFHSFTLLTYMRMMMTCSKRSVIRTSSLIIVLWLRSFFILTEQQQSTFCKQATMDLKCIPIAFMAIFAMLSFPATMATTGDWCICKWDGVEKKKWRKQTNQSWLKPDIHLIFYCTCFYNSSRVWMWLEYVYIQLYMCRGWLWHRCVRIRLFLWWRCLWYVQRPVLGRWIQWFFLQGRRLWTIEEHFN